MNQVTLENFRCFRERQRASLAPLTLLMGENGTGKTSFLALLRALWDAAYLSEVPDFKEASYDLGSFDEIAHYRGGRGGRAPEFWAGFDAVPDPAGNRGKAESNGPFHRFEVTFARKGTAPAPTEWLFGREDLEIAIRAAEDASQEICYRTGRGAWSWSARAEPGARFLAGRDSLPHYAYLALREKGNLKPVGDSPIVTDEDVARLKELLYGFDYGFDPFGDRPFASAPVRSRPRRTYDPSRPAHDPEGETIPMYLSMAFFEDKKSWKRLKDALEKFGQEAKPTARSGCRMCAILDNDVASEVFGQDRPAAGKAFRFSPSHRKLLDRNACRTKAADA